MQRNKKIPIVVVLVFVAFFGVHRFASAATLQLSPSSGNYQVGDTMRVAVTVASPLQAINAASGVLTFPSDKLQFVSASKDGSIMTIWAQDPSYSEYAGMGSVSFEGVVPNPGFAGISGKIITVTFRVKAVGAATLSFSSASVLANDGMGTNILTNYIPGTFTLGAIVNNLPLLPEDTALNGTPAAPNIVSSTHPNPSLWYSDKNPVFSWNLPSGVTGVARLIDQNPTSTPAGVSTGTGNTYTAANLADGVWYMHVRFRNANGWGKTAHFRFRIDTVKPESFIITELKKDDQKNPVSKFTFTAYDKISGVHSYEVQIDNTYFIPWQDDGSHVYTTSPLGPGKHVIVVRAIDGAANFIEDSKTFSIEGINRPVITEYPQFLKSGSYMLLKGTTYPNIEVDIYIHKIDNGGFLTRQPLIFKRNDNQTESVQKVISDSRGEFTFVSPKKMESGTYAVWVRAINELGASSESTDTITIPVMTGAIAKIGIFVINIFIILITLAGLIITLAFMLIHGHYKIRYLRERLIAKYFGNDRDGQKGLSYLDRDLQEKILSIQKKIVEKEKVTDSERAFLLKIKKALHAVEKIVEIEVDDSSKGF